MSWKAYFPLGALGLALALLIASFQPFPGYMDADYYFAGGIQVAQGRGFNEPYVWNYLENPSLLPHPSHGYWMPLASILAALGIWVTGSTTYASGRLAFLVLAAIVPMITAKLAFSFSGRKFPAVLSGLLAVFSIYYAPFLPVTDNYGIYIILGSLFMFAVGRTGIPSALALGGLAGMMTLARSDGVLWLMLGVAAVVRAARQDKMEEPPPRQGVLNFGRERLLGLTSLLAAFALVVAPWTLRNLEVYEQIRAPGAEKLLWLTSYDEIFAYPSSILTVERWLDQGFQALMAARASALQWNLLNAVAAQGGIFLVPLILLGAWERRRDLSVQLGVAGWFVLLVVMTLALPAVGARGGWFHAGAGLQGLWWSLAPLGLERIVASARKQQLFGPKAQMVFGGAMVLLAAVLTGLIFWMKVLPGWGEGEGTYPGLDKHLVAAGAYPEDIVMVRNPPGYFLMTGRSAIVVPYSDAEGMMQAAETFGADFIIIEAAGAAGPIRTVYDNLGSEAFVFLGEVDGTRLFRILR